MLYPQDFSSEDQTLIGIIDGVNPSFSFQANPYRIEVYKNGIRMTANVDYYGGGMGVTFVPLQVPHPGDIVVVKAFL